MKQITEDKLYRHEYKFLASSAQLETLGVHMQALFPMVTRDPHVGPSGIYEIRSVYLDDLYDHALQESIDGTDPREKWRIRAYNASDTLIHLECKRKERGMTRKEACTITRMTYDAIMGGGILLPGKGNDPVLNRFYYERLTRHLEPKCIVAYKREPWVCPEGNVRVTFDREISSSTDYDRFFDPALPMRPVMPMGMHLLEMKYDAFMPDAIYHSLQIGHLRAITFSKYGLCRTYADERRANVI